MNGLLYRLTLTEPVLANSLGGEPNSAQSSFYIPGGLVRGAAINTYKGEKDAGDETFRRLFLDGRTRFLNAYPLVDGERSLPAPITWQVKRKASREDKRLFISAPNDIETEKVKFKYWAQASDQDPIAGLEEEWQINIHTQRDAEKGRSTSDAGAVYRYIAIPAGIMLEGVILTENDEDAKFISNLLHGTILLGKSRNAGYGCAEVECQPLDEQWREYKVRVISPSSKFMLTLLSSAIVRDDAGQFSLDIQPALQTRIGKIHSIKAYCRQEIVGGFNRTWGLPLPQVPAIAAGSVFEVETEQEVSAEVLASLEETGIGERRAEGFGRLVATIPIERNWRWELKQAQHSQPVPQTLPANDPTALLMLSRLFLRYMDEQITTAARHLTETYEKNKVPNSQLSRWRVILRDALGKMGTEDALARVSKFCEENKNKTGWEKMSKARVRLQTETPRLASWIETVLENPSSLKEALGKGYRSNWMLGTSSISIDEFNVEYRLRLLDAVLSMMAKINVQRGNNG